tara:strand:+ start:2062 stop:2853 length:792 start_codon:yes stop_codon:yes gene_type:complete
MNCAIYIDADNVSYKSLEEILMRGNNNNVIIKKIYADWTNYSMNKWAEKAKKYGFQGIQCFGNEKKQTSDIYMVTDIVSDLYNNNFIEMVILATSDIDFTHLCHLIKQKNKKLVIFAPQKSNITNLVTESKKEKNLPKLVEENLPKAKKSKKNTTNDEYLQYLIMAMKDSISIYISNYKKNLRKVVPSNLKGLDINHIDKTLTNYPKHFKLMKKGNKIKIFGLFHLHKYSKDEFQKNNKEIENKYNELFKVYNFKSVSKIIHD